MKLFTAILLGILAFSICGAQEPMPIATLATQPITLGNMAKMLTLLNEAINQEEAYVHIARASGSRDNFTTIRVIVNGGLLNTLPQQLAPRIPVVGIRYITHSYEKALLDKYDCRLVSLVYNPNSGRQETAYCGYVIEIVYYASLADERVYKYADKDLKIPHDQGG